MPITLPNLDDRSYSDLVEEVRALIPVYAPEWTNHNPSDPGVTLVELFAYLTEMMLYRLDRVTDANVLAFLRLLNEPGWQPAPGRSLAENVRDTVLLLRRPYRAVTCEDFEWLASEASGALDEGEAALAGRVARALCVPDRNLEEEDAALRYSPRPGHVSVIIVPKAPPENAAPEPTPELVRRVAEHLAVRRLVTTRVHVAGPRYFKLTVRLALVLAPDALTLTEEQVRAPAARAVRRFLHPLEGGPEGRGWPFGRDVYVSELYELLDVLPGVDYVTRVTDAKTGRELDELAVAAEDAGRLRRNASGELTSVRVEADELVAPEVELKIVFPV